jgi:hypothetical protein
MTSDASGPMPSVVGGHQRDIGREHDQIAMGDVDQPHDAEDQRQAGGKHGVEPADQHALDDDVDPLGHREGRSPLPTTAGRTRNPEQQEKILDSGFAAARQ